MSTREILDIYRIMGRLELDPISKQLLIKTYVDEYLNGVYPEDPEILSFMQMDYGFDLDRARTKRKIDKILDEQESNVKQTEEFIKDLEEKGKTVVKTKPEKPLPKKPPKLSPNYGLTKWLVDSNYDDDSSSFVPSSLTDDSDGPSFPSVYSDLSVYPTSEFDDDSSGFGSTDADTVYDDVYEESISPSIASYRNKPAETRFAELVSKIQDKKAAKNKKVLDATIRSAIEKRRKMLAKYADYSDPDTEYEDEDGWFDEDGWTGSGVKKPRFSFDKTKLKKYNVFTPVFNNGKKKRYLFNGGVKLSDNAVDVIMHKCPDKHLSKQEQNILGTFYCQNNAKLSPEKANIVFGDYRFTSPKETLKQLNIMLGLLNAGNDSKQNIKDIMKAASVLYKHKIITKPSYLRVVKEIKNHII